MELAQLWQIILHFDQHLGSFATQYGVAIYAILFAIVFCEIGLLPLFFLPGDPLLFLCGAFCASGAINIGLIMPLLFVATVTGSTLAYIIGRRVGRQVYRRDYRWLNKAALNRSHAFYERYGQISFLLSPYIAVVRTFAPFIAGVSRMSPSLFVASVCGGAVLWVGGLLIGGYFLGNVPIVRDHMSLIVLSGIGAAVAALVVSALYRYLKSSGKPGRRP